MKRQYMSAGAIVVSPNLDHPQTLLLDQIRKTGERQVVASKGRIEPGEPPLLAAAREVTEESGLSDLTYVSYLGQQSYGFTDDDGAPAEKTVDWFMFAAHSMSFAVRRDEGFTGARWLDLDDALAAATHGGFCEYLERARDIIGWRQGGNLGYSQVLSGAVWRFSREATMTLADETAAGALLCGSAARGDFVLGWSDLDFVAWGMDPCSSVGARLTELVKSVEQESGINASLHFADVGVDDSHSRQSVHEMKLRTVLRRTGIDASVVAGSKPTLAGHAPDAVPLAANIAQLGDLARELQASAVTGPDRRVRARRTLAALCNAGRQVVYRLDSCLPLRLPVVATALEQRWPGNPAAQLIRCYDSFRQSGAVDIGQAEALALPVPAALDDLCRLASNQVRRSRASA